MALKLRLFRPRENSLRSLRLCASLTFARKDAKAAKKEGATKLRSGRGLRLFQCHSGQQPLLGGVFVRSLARLDCSEPFRLVLVPSGAAEGLAAHAAAQECLDVVKENVVPKGTTDPRVYTKRCDDGGVRSDGLERGLPLGGRRVREPVAQVQQSGPVPSISTRFGGGRLGSRPPSFGRPRLYGTSLPRGCRRDRTGPPCRSTFPCS